MPRTRTLILLAKSSSADVAAKVAAGEMPHFDLVELARALDATVFDFNDVARSTHPLVQLARKKDPYWGLATLGAVHRHAYDNIYATGEDIGVRFGPLLHATGTYGKTTIVIHHGDTPKRRVALRALGHAIWRNVICLSERQREVLIDEIGFPRQKVHHFFQPTDERFFQTSEASPDPGDYVFSCGRENRDYPTLQKAVEGLPMTFRVVASGWAPHATFDAANNIRSTTNLRVEQGLSYRGLRNAYAGARFFVMPLNRVDYAAGVTGICEAMAMGKAVIASASPGITEYVKHGVSGLVVPVGDWRALREAIERLWGDSALAQRMGDHNRRWIEEEMTVDQFVQRVAGLFGMPLPAANHPEAIPPTLRPAPVAPRGLSTAD